MGKCISCGKINNYFKYILLSIFFIILNNSIYGFNYNDSFEEVNIFKFIMGYDDKNNNNTDNNNNDNINNKVDENKKELKKFFEYISQHYLIRQILSYCGTFIMGWVFYCYEIRVSHRERLKSTIIEKKQESKELSLIYNDSFEDLNSFKNYFIYLIIIVFLVIEEQLINIYFLALKDVDFWMFELLIITYINSKMFKYEIYKHHWFAILFNLVIVFLKLGAIILSIKEKEENNTITNFIDKKRLPIIYCEYKLFIPFGIFIYLILIFLRSLVNSYLKYFMDKKYISESKILRTYGLFGTIICIFACIFTTIKECNSYQNNLERDIDISDYFCQFQKEEKNTIKIYFDSFSLYFQPSDNKEILLEMTIYFFGILTFFFYKYYYFLVIKLLTPVHIVFSYPIEYFLEKVILAITTVIISLIRNKNTKFLIFVDKSIDYNEIKFFLDFFGDIISIIGFLIYFEIIELNFDKFNYNTIQNMIVRSFGESKEIANSEDGFENDERGQQIIEEDDLIKN